MIELAGRGPGPFAAMTLADRGAEAIRIDRGGKRGVPGDPRQDLLNWGKKSALVDPKRSGAVLGLVENADIFIEGYCPGMGEWLGVGPEDCLQHNPTLWSPLIWAARASGTDIAGLT